MPSFEISANADQVKRAIEEKRRAVESEVKKSVKKTATEIRTTLYSMTPRGPSFGNVASKTTVEGGAARAAFTSGGKDAIWEVSDYDAKVGSNVPHMKFLEYGTRAHGPVTAKFLHFFTTEGEVFAKWVRGIKPMRIFAKTRMMYQKIWPKNVQAAVRKGLRL